MLEKQCFDIYIYTYTYKGIKYWGIRRKVCFFPRCSLESLSVSSWYRNTKRVRSLTLREWRIENREENLAACRPRNESTCGECNLAWRNTGVGTVVTLVSLARSFFPFLSFFGRDRRENRSVFFFFKKENRDVLARRKKQRWIWKKTRVSRVGMRAAINIVLRELFWTR